MICFINFKLQTIVSVFAVSLLLVCLLPKFNYAADKVVSDNDSVASTAEPTFTYNPVGLRDPFAPLVQKIRQSYVKPKRNLGPLEKFQLSQFRLMAMMIVKGTPRAMVKAPDGKSYTVKIGDPIGPNGGVVTRIETKTVELDEASGQRLEKSPDRVVVEETGVDNYTGKIFKEERYIEM